jgi:hypothetical protein
MAASSLNQAEKKNAARNQVTEYKVKVAIEYLSSIQHFLLGNGVQAAAT